MSNTRHAEYHALDALGGSTAAKLATQCLADALAPFGGSDAATIGSCVDAIWCEGASPSDVYEVQARRSAASIADAAARGLYAITASMQDTIAGCLGALHGHRHAELIRAASTPQTQFDWIEQTPYGPIACKGMADLVTDAVIWDLKTVGGAGAGCPVDPAKFAWTARDRGIDIQLAHYRRGKRANGWGGDHAGIIAASTREPYMVEIFGIDPIVLDAAEQRLIEYVYPLRARLLAGDVTYLGYGELRDDGLEPIHILGFTRRD